MPQFAKNGTAISVGSFDGPHIGHESLFCAISAFAKKNNCFPGIVTFTNPLREFKKKQYEGDISTLSERLAIAEDKGVAFAIVIDFSDEFIRIEGNVFFSILMHTFNLKFLAEGLDFRCGYKGSFGQEEIQSFAEKNGIECSFVPPVLYRSERVSSSFIRQCILKGDFCDAEQMLGRKYCLDFALVKKSLKEDNVIIEKTDIRQALPPDGIYEVLAITPGNKIRTHLTADGQILRLALPPQVASEIRSVEFISGN